jgi:hypothetical protein
MGLQEHHANFAWHSAKKSWMSPYLTSVLIFLLRCSRQTLDYFSWRKSDIRRASFPFNTPSTGVTFHFLQSISVFSPKFIQKIASTLVISEKLTLAKEYTKPWNKMGNIWRIGRLQFYKNNLRIRSFAKLKKCLLGFNPLDSFILLSRQEAEYARHSKNPAHSSDWAAQVKMHHELRK